MKTAAKQERQAGGIEVRNAKDGTPSFRAHISIEGVPKVGRFYPDRDDAEAELIAWRNAKRDVRNGRMTIGEVSGLKLTMARFWEDTYLPFQRREYPFSVARVESTWTLHLREHFGHLLLSKVTPDEVRAWQRKRRSETGRLRSLRDARGRVLRDSAGKPRMGGEPPKASTLNLELIQLQAMLNYAVACGLLSKSPLHGQRLSLAQDAPRAPTMIKENEIAFYNAANPAVTWAMRIALFTGLREGEIAGLRWRAVDFDAGTIKVEVSTKRMKVDGKWQLIDKCPKTRKTRVLPIPGALRDELTARRGLPDGFVAVGPSGQRWNPKHLSEEWTRTVERAGLVDFRFHDLRHCYAGRLLDSGATAFDIMRLLGHSTINMSARYTHPSDDRQQRLVDGLEDNAKDARVNAPQVVRLRTRYAR